MSIWRMRIACWIPKATNTNLEYTYFFSTTTMVTRMHLIVTLYVHYRSCLSSELSTLEQIPKFCIRTRIRTSIGPVYNVDNL